MRKNEIKMKKILLNLVALLLILSACSDNNNNMGGIDVEEPTPTPVEGPAAEMSFRSAVSTNQTIGIDDTGIAELDLVVCKNDKFQYVHQGYFSELYGLFRSTLKVDQGIDIYYFANCRFLLATAKMQEGEAWEAIQERLILTETEIDINGQTVLPMWGFMANVDIKDNIINNLGTIRLLRSVASINVTIDPARTTGLDFEPTVVYVYNGADRTYAAPAYNNLFIENNELNGIKEPLSPQGMETSMVKSSDFDKMTGASNTFYVFDNETDSYLEGTGNRRTRLIIGGKLNGSSTLTYCPLDFFKSENGQQKELLKVTRNSQYNLTITSVNGEGWPDPDIAAEKVPVNIDYEVIDWTENTHENIAVDGVDYLSISTKSVTLYHQTGSKATIRLSGTFEKDDFKLYFKGNHNGTGEEFEKGIENERFHVELEGTGTNLMITVTAKGSYSQTNAIANLDEFVIEAGRIRFDVNIKQILSGGWYDGGEEELHF